MHITITCLNCDKPLNPDTAVYLCMNSQTNEFTTSKEVEQEWLEKEESQGWFAFGPDCGPRILRNPSLCKFEGNGC